MRFKESFGGAFGFENSPQDAMFEPEAVAFFAHFHGDLKVRNPHQLFCGVIADGTVAVAGEVPDRLLLCGITIEKVVGQPGHFRQLVDLFVVEPEATAVSALINLHHTHHEVGHINLTTRTSTRGGAEHLGLGDRFGNLFETIDDTGTGRQAGSDSRPRSSR